MLDCGTERPKFFPLSSSSFSLPPSPFISTPKWLHLPPHLFRLPPLPPSPPARGQLIQSPTEAFRGGRERNSEELFFSFTPIDSVGASLSQREREGHFHCSHFFSFLCGQLLPVLFLLLLLRCRRLLARKKGPTNIVCRLP